MNYFLAVVVTGLLTVSALASRDSRYDQIPEDKMQECLAEADAVVMGHKPSELLAEVTDKLAEKMDTYNSMEDIEKEMNKVLGGTISSDKGRQLVKDCDQFSPLVRKAMFHGSCGTWFGMDIGVHGPKRDHHLEGHDHLKALILYFDFCSALDDIKEASKV